MSKIRKARKLRTPNVPLAVGPAHLVSVENPGVSARSSNPTTETTFDYSYTRKDLTRIGLLAGTFITLLIALSFFIR